MFPALTGGRWSGCGLLAERGATFAEGLELDRLRLHWGGRHPGAGPRGPPLPERPGRLFVLQRGSQGFLELGQPQVALLTFVLLVLSTVFAWRERSNAEAQRLANVTIAAARDEAEEKRKQAVASQKVAEEARASEAKARAQSDKDRDVAQDRTEELQSVLESVDTGLHDHIAQLAGSGKALEFLTGLVKEHLQPADRSAEPVAATRSRARNEDETGQRALQTGDALGSEREYQLCADDFASIVARGQATPDDLAQQNHCLVGLADNLAHAGRLAAAERRYREAATAVGPSAGFELSISSSTAWSKLADVELDLGMAADAAQAATSSGDRAKPWAADDQPLEQQKRARKRVAVSYLYSGHSARVAGEPDAARRWFSSALLIDQGLAAAPRAPPEPRATWLKISTAWPWLILTRVISPKRWPTSTRPPPIWPACSSWITTKWSGSSTRRRSRPPRGWR